MLFLLYQVHAILPLKYGTQSYDSINLHLGSFQQLVNL